MGLIEGNMELLGFSSPAKLTIDDLGFSSNLFGPIAGKFNSNVTIGEYVNKSSYCQIISISLTQ